jgi:hypothetical protein
MNLLRLSVLALVCCLIFIGTFIFGCSDDDKSVAPKGAWSWSPLGSGMGEHLPRILVLTVFDGKLIAGGQFSKAGGNTAYNIAAWDDSSRSPLGSGQGLYGGSVVFVQALTAFGGKLVAGGQFTVTGITDVYNIAAWDGTSWSPLGSGMNSFGVNSLTVYDNKLIAGGPFTQAGGIPANYIAAWNGSSWLSLGSGTDGWVLALAPFGNELIAGGEFLQAGGIVTNGIAAWNGSSWKPLGEGISGSVGGNWPTVYCLAARDTRLYVGGQFTTADSTTVNCIAEWSFK